MNNCDHYITPSAMEIIERHVGLFGRGPWSVRDSIIGWGFACGDGWYPILNQLFTAIENILVSDELDTLEIIQVKQKLGSLRIYFRNDNDRVSANIDEAAREAAVTCEDCSGHSPSVGSRSGWLTNICNPCTTKQGQHRYLQ